MGQWLSIPQNSEQSIKKKRVESILQHITNGEKVLIEKEATDQEWDAVEEVVKNEKVYPFIVYSSSNSLDAVYLTSSNLRHRLISYVVFRAFEMIDETSPRTFELIYSFAEQNFLIPIGSQRNLHDLVYSALDRMIECEVVVDDDGVYSYRLDEKIEELMSDSHIPLTILELRSLFPNQLDIEPHIISLAVKRLWKKGKILSLPADDVYPVPRYVLSNVFEDVCSFITTRALARNVTMDEDQLCECLKCNLIDSPHLLNHRFVRKILSKPEIKFEHKVVSLAERVPPAEPRIRQETRRIVDVYFAEDSARKRSRI